MMKMLKKSEFHAGRIAFPHVILHCPEIRFAMGYPERRELCILWGGFQQILHPGPVSEEPLLQRLVLKELNFPAHPHHSTGTLCTGCVETELYFWVLP